MKSALAGICLTVTILASALPAQGDEPDNESPYKVRPIKSLDEIQGHWGFVPKGDRSFGGHTLDIDGTKGRFREVTDTPEPMPDNEVGLELIGGALRLKSESPDVPKNEWQLAEFGDYKCLFRFATLKQNSPQPHLYVEVLYWHPPKDGDKQAAGSDDKGAKAKPRKKKAALLN